MFFPSKRFFVIFLSIFFVACATNSTKNSIESEKSDLTEISENETEKTQPKSENSPNQENPKNETEETKPEIENPPNQENPKDETPQNPQPQEETEEIQKVETISLLFAGDIMAHEENFGGGRFDRIWTHVSSYIKNADVAFANVEAPVMDGRKWQAYPTFNMHTDYVEQAINAGFRVFSLANNHTNDQGLEGISSTRNFFANRKGVWAAGLREKSNGNITHKIVEIKKDEQTWKILFVAITEILNRPDFASYIDYYPSTKNKRQELKTALKKLNDENEHDIFVISVHTDEPEYVLEITDDHKRFFRELATECGADVVWGNHPHVAKSWEEIDANGKTALLMYANGNTISGQRRDPQFNRPKTMRDYTGEGIFVRAEFERDKNGIRLTNNEAKLITTMIASDGRYVLRFLNDDLIKSLDVAENLKWRDYLSARKKIMEEYLPNLNTEFSKNHTK